MPASLPEQCPPLPGSGSRRPLGPVREQPRVEVVGRGQARDALEQSGAAEAGPCKPVARSNGVGANAFLPAPFRDPRPEGGERRARALAPAGGEAGAITTAFMAPALAPETPTISRSGSSRSRSSTPQVKAPWAPPPWRAKLKPPQARARAAGGAARRVPEDREEAPSRGTALAAMGSGHLVSAMSPSDRPASVACRQARSEVHTREVEVREIAVVEPMQIVEGAGVADLPRRPKHELAEEALLLRPAPRGQAKGSGRGRG